MDLLNKEEGNERDQSISSTTNETNHSFPSNPSFQIDWSNGTYDRVKQEVLPDLINQTLDLPSALRPMDKPKLPVIDDITIQICQQKEEISRSKLYTEYQSKHLQGMREMRNEYEGMQIKTDNPRPIQEEIESGDRLERKRNEKISQKRYRSSKDIQSMQDSILDETRINAVPVKKRANSPENTREGGSKEKEDPSEQMKAEELKRLNKNEYLKKYRNEQKSQKVRLEEIMRENEELKRINEALREQMEESEKISEKRRQDIVRLSMENGALRTKFRALEETVDKLPA